MRDADYKNLALIYENNQLEKEWIVTSGWERREFTYSFGDTFTVRAPDEIKAVGRYILALKNKGEPDMQEWYSGFSKFGVHNEAFIMLCDQELFIAVIPKSDSLGPMGFKSKVSAAAAYLVKHPHELEDSPLWEYLFDSEDPDTFSDLL